MDAKTEADVIGASLDLQPGETTVKSVLGDPPFNTHLYLETTVGVS